MAENPQVEVEVEDGAKRLEDHYELLGTLGTGGFSVVQKAVSKEDGTEVAIKTLKKHGSRSVSNALVENEIMVMSRIVDVVSPHPNVINLLDVFEDSDAVHLVLELCSGGELFDRIVQQERFSEAGAARVIRQIASGLASLHGAKISHRDMKPENCLFSTPDDEAPLKIMDFGLSHIEGETNPVVGLFGSIDYVAPEALSKRSARAAGDMWSLGVILYILLCGYPPFHAPSNKAKQELILVGSFDFDDSAWKPVSSSAKQLIRSLLTVDPSRRPTAAELVLHPWVTGASARSEPMEAEVVKRLKTFNARRKFRAVAYASIVSNQFMLRTKQLRRILQGWESLSTEELALLHENFKRISSNGTSVTLSEFEAVLRAMSMASLLPAAKRIYQHFDADGNGSVDMREIVVGFSSLRKASGDDALRLCFKMYDTDNSGFIDREELADMLKALPEEYLPPDIMEPGKLDEFFDRMDANCDGQLSFEEFKDALQADKFLVDALLQPVRKKMVQAL
eukprot:TRINITY_DN21239_c0_g1_i1.p1 TRINITY_DN21239_c0_g1~~TRINITY_DN21239_c0_g1_i1.p1  ORF type:complete len:509 (+),score=100.82 TRINITY_DN21239_c0_g1_i1:95-1621(+)